MQLFGFRGLPFQARCKFFNLCITCVGLLTFFILIGHLLRHGSHSGSSFRPKRAVIPVHPDDLEWNSKFTCFFHTCFEINDCVYGVHDRIGVYVYPTFEFVSNQTQKSYIPEFSDEYSQLLDAIKHSPYYQRDASKACVLIPSIDMLSQSNLDFILTSTLLNSLPAWNGGRNHLIFNMLPGAYPNFSTTPDFYYGKAVLAGGGFSRQSYREGFDISIPVFNPITRNEKFLNSAATSKRPLLLTILTHGFHSSELTQKLIDLANGEQSATILILEACPTVRVSHDQLPWKRCSSTTGEEFAYPDILEQSQFCLLLPGVRHGTPDFTDAMMTGCIPVVIGDVGVLPFFEVLDWDRASVRVWPYELDHITERLRGIPQQMVTEMKEQVLFLYKRYFSSMAAIAVATLHIINGRVFPTSKHNYEWWNTQQFDVKITNKFQYSYPTPIALPPSPTSQGFTAVILTFDRVPMLFEVIRNVASAPSLAKILVIWNNVKKPPPPVNQWPRIKKPIQVIRTRQNKLSNRFIPYSEIRTAAVLSLDDDITMLTADELEFGYKAWQQFPTRLVGYPGRVHTYDYQRHKWKYESIWLNNISLVLTGAAFYHKFYHYLYSSVMPVEIRNWVDNHMNCEDITMNFLITNYTGLPPLKISPRKKFKCPSCVSEESLWSDPQHYLERDECINIFEQFFGGMPLRTVKFRLDPVLYKDPIEERFKSYPNMGDL